MGWPDVTVESLKRFLLATAGFFIFRKKYNAYNVKGEDLLMYNIWKPSYCEGERHKRCYRLMLDLSILLDKRKINFGIKKKNISTAYLFFFVFCKKIQRLSILHEFDDRVRDMEKMLYEIGRKEIIQDSITGALVYGYWSQLILLESKYDLIDKRQSDLAQRRES